MFSVAYAACPEVYAGKGGEKLFSTGKGTTGLLRDPPKGSQVTSATVDGFVRFPRSSREEEKRGGSLLIDVLK